jgi:hypothetical protein
MSLNNTKESRFVLLANRLSNNNANFNGKGWIILRSLDFLSLQSICQTTMLTRMVKVSNSKHGYYWSLDVKWIFGSRARRWWNFWGCLSCCGSNAKPLQLQLFLLGGWAFCPNEFCTNVNFHFYEITKNPKQVVD